MGHADMRIRVIAQSPGDFNAWLKHQQQPAAPATSVQAGRGAGVFIIKNCVNCHSIRGLSSKGRVAPDLTHMGSRETLAAGTIPNTSANLARWLKNPQAIKKGVYMPNNGLTAGQIKDLTAYLEGLK